MADTPLQALTNVSHRTIRKKSASPYKVARFSPYKLPTKAKSLLNLVGHPHAHPNPPPPAFNLPTTSSSSNVVDVFEHQGMQFQATAHVKLPFNLYQNGEQLLPTSVQRAHIMALFPTCFAVAFAPPFLIVRCRTLPPKPWPVTVASLPLFLTNDPDERPMYMGVTTQGPKLKINADTGLWKTPSREAFREIFRAFEREGAMIDSVQWFGIGFKILAAAEPVKDWKKKLPGFINDLYVGYIIGEEVREEKALRRKLSAGRQHDDETYSDLRPGVIVAGENDFDSSEVMSTSGLCVQSPNGKKYFTVASHGFPVGVDAVVKHPNRSGQELGTIAKIFGASDISLCELKQGLRYSRETFTTTDAGIPSQPFRDFADTDLLKVGVFLYMDTPYSGRCEGVLMSIETKRIPNDDPFAEPTEYLMCIYAYFGNGIDTILEGCCGGVIWDDHYDAIGQFRFQSSERDQMCYCPTFMRLRDLGYTLSQA